MERAGTAVAAGLATKGITAVDAPVSGGPSGAEKGTLAVMVSCPRALADELRPVIAPIGKFFYIGETPGMGQTMKVINNLMSAAAQAITAESLVMGAKARAVLHGRYYVSCEDIRAVAVPVLRHRILTNFTAASEGINPDTVVKKLIEETPDKESELTRDERFKKIFAS